MQICRLLAKEFNKKGRSFLLLPFFLLIISCASQDLGRYGKVTPNNTADSDTFIFSVSDEFIRKNRKSKSDKTNPKISEAEADLLQKLLKDKKYCLDGYGAPKFTITSRQEKVFDMTFAHLIEQNYRARPVAPKMYFGHCVVR